MSHLAKKWLAPAKLNLFLHVTGQRDDGYHTLQTAFIFLDYFDELEFELNQTGQIKRIDQTGRVKIDLPEFDLCINAATLLQQQFKVKQGVTISLKKNISAGAGLGGGSSNAATVLIALNKLWKINLSTPELIKIGRKLGDDVPVFLHGENTLALGVGDEFSPLKLPQIDYCVLIPRNHVSTSEIFSDSSLTRDTPIKTIRGSLNPSQMSGLVNDLEQITCLRYPLVGEALNWLKQFGDARMSGTGSSVFLACDSRNAANNILHQLPAIFGDKVDGFVARSLLRHPHKDDVPA